jgi:hypothetical protein
MYGWILIRQESISIFKENPNFLMSNHQKYFPLTILGITRTTQKEKIFLNFRPKLQRKNNYLVWKEVKS